MSREFSPDKTNRTPWADVVTLIQQNETEDSAGYKEQQAQQEREIFCTFSEGASRAEYYEAMKAGVRVSASVEIWEDDYEQERRLEHEGTLYEIGRVYPTGRGTLLLYLTEVWR